MRGSVRRLRYELRRRALGLALVFLGVAVLLFSLLLSVKLTPEAIEMALGSATDDITIAVNNTVTNVLAEDGLDYDNLVTIQRDSSGNVTALVANTSNINILKAKITNAVVESFAGSDVTRVSIPIGNFIGGALLSGRGPRLKLDILSVTNVTTALRHEFSSAGINQTRHQIILDVEVSLDILFGGVAGTDKVVTEVCIAETVIVGTVPNAYADVT